MPSITKRALDEKKKLRHTKAEKEKNAAATLQDLASLQGEVEALEKQANPENANGIALPKVIWSSLSGCVLSNYETRCSLLRF